LTVELTKALDIVELNRQFTQDLILGVDRLHAAQVEQGIQQHGGVAGR